MNDTIRVWLDEEEEEVKVLDTYRHCYLLPEELRGRVIVSVYIDDYGTFSLELEEVVE